MNSDRLERIRLRLEEELAPERLELVDDSHLHAGHAGARDGRGHFRVYIVSKVFDTMRPVQRHQLVYQALGELMRTDIHALNISAHAPDEALQANPRYSTTP